jgi:hypothetical protein
VVRPYLEDNRSRLFKGMRVEERQWSGGNESVPPDSPVLCALWITGPNRANSVEMEVAVGQQPNNNLGYTNK